MTADTAWMTRAACAGQDPQLFYPGPGNNPYAAGRRICQRCPVQTQCLEYDLRLVPYHRHGTWGGVAYLERRELDGAETAP